MKPEPLFEAVESVLSGYTREQRDRTPVVFLTPQGERLTQRVVEELSQAAGMVLICGHYAGVDERAVEGLPTRQISIGDYVLTGGELPAMILIDAVSRLVPGVVGSPESVSEDSITTGLLQHPIYTRPAEFRGMAVPEVLRSGHHAEIERWRRRESSGARWPGDRTCSKRPRCPTMTASSLPGWVTRRMANKLSKKPALVAPSAVSPVAGRLRDSV